MTLNIFWNWDGYINCMDLIHYSWMRVLISFLSSRPIQFIQDVGNSFIYSTVISYHKPRCPAPFQFFECQILRGYPIQCRHVSGGEQEQLFLMGMYNLLFETPSHVSECFYPIKMVDTIFCSFVFYYYFFYFVFLFVCTCL